jgi:sRNA-binding carbon storage regulator CsrA
MPNPGSLVISRQLGQSFLLGDLRITVRAIAGSRVKLAIESTPPIEAWCDTRLAVQIGESYVVVEHGGTSKVRLAICAPRSVVVMREELMGVGNG